MASWYGPIPVLLHNRFQHFGDRLCLGEFNDTKDDYNWLTFKEIFDASTAFVCGLRSKLRLKAGDCIGICGEPRIAWMIADVGCILAGIVVVPMHNYLTSEEMRHIIVQSELKAVICDNSLVDKFENIQETPCLITLEEHPHLTSTKTLIKLGSKLSENFLPFIARPHELVTVVYTSGSTGMPKGACFTNAIWNNFVVQRDCLLDYSEQIVNPSTTSLGHVSDREGIYGTFFCGGRTGFCYVNDLLSIEVLGPNWLSCTPIFFNKLYQSFTIELNELEQKIDGMNPEELEKLEKSLNKQSGRSFISKFIAKKMSRIKRVKHINRKLLLLKYKSKLGKRLSHVVIGGAVSTQELREWLGECYGRCREGYGSTEAGPIAGQDGILSNAKDVDYRLEDVPDMGYSSNDTPYPRGELLIKNPWMIKEYHNDSVQTQRAFTSDGFYRTGDIVEVIQLDKDIQVRVIDRRNNFFKLSGATMAEAIFETSHKIQHAFVTHASMENFPTQSGITVVVVPNHDAFQMGTDFSSKAVEVSILNELNKKVSENGLRACYRPHCVVVDDKEWTQANGLLTSSDKPRRNKLRIFYQDLIDNKWDQMTSFSDNRKSLIACDINNKELTDDVILKLVCDVSDVPYLDSKVPFGAQCSSLTITALRNSIYDKLDISVEPNVIFEWPLLRLLEELRKASPGDSLNTKIDFGVDVDLDIQQLKKEIYRLNFEPLTERSLQDRTSSNVLITGATGFVGVHLLAELLRNPAIDAVYVLTRGDSSENVLHRIKNSLSKFGLRNLSQDKRIIPIAGSLAERNLGISQDNLEILQGGKIDLVIHAAANVNHVLPYSKLRDENVLGTIKVLEFVSLINTITPCRFIYVSSTSVRDYSSNAHEGYIASKYVSEQLVLKAIQQGLDGAIGRLGFVVWTSSVGIPNTNDWLTALILGVKSIGCAPKSEPNSLFRVIEADVAARGILSLFNEKGKAKKYEDNDFIFSLESGGHDLIWKDLWNYLQVKQVSLSEWRRKVTPECLAKLRTDSPRAVHGLSLFANGLLPTNPPYNNNTEFSTSNIISTTLDLTFLEKVNEEYLDE